MKIEIGLSLGEVVPFSRETMSIEQIEQFLRVIGQTHWNMDYQQFLQVTQFSDDFYAKEKFKTFQTACQLLNQFDSETLQKLLSVY